VPACPGGASDVIPATALFCEVQPSEFAPPTSVRHAARARVYYLRLMLDGSQPPGSSQIFDNHIPARILRSQRLDSQISKTTAVEST